MFYETCCVYLEIFKWKKSHAGLPTILSKHKISLILLAWRFAHPLYLGYDPSTRSIAAYSPRWSNARLAISSCAAPMKSM